MKVSDLIARSTDQCLNHIKPMPKISNPKTKVPYESLVGRAPIEPIFDKEVQDQFDEAIAPIMGATRWKKWGMERAYGAKGTTVLLTGEPGTGKTTAARFYSKKVSQGIIAISMADIGGGDPGDTERAVKEIFAYAKSKDNCALFLDECEAVLWDRSKAGPNSMWMLGVITTIFTQIEAYPGLIFLATNFEDMLDRAIKRRCTSIIEIPLPSMLTRQSLWLQKIPKEYPFQPNEAQTQALAIPAITGSEIETCIQTETRRAIRLGRNPKFDYLLQAAEEMAGNRQAKKKRD